MKLVTKVIGLFLIVFSIVFYQAAPFQRGHGHGSHKKHYHHGHHKPKYKKVVYYKAPRHYKKHYYKPARPYHYSHKKNRHPRVYHSRPVVVVNL
ncbi:hypothetical protein DRF62_19365 [Chryseobacterium piscium]|uniref:Uncharacterized protein n=1 Tax=Chryseobacterium piscium TaxID=333702 RepID=A0A3D9B957_9FLAO|nr:hypothetical protein [Chryseobacterium piscium]REC49847.1 hypothetical protein DRF62_19365 [Chryseobacterium piscium]